MHYVYILRLANNHFYTGSTTDINKRLKEHKNGKSESTKNLGPVKLIWYCVFPNRLQARRFEKYLKTGSGQAFRNKRLIKK
jgi:putative endonuclease